MPDLQHMPTVARDLRQLVERLPLAAALNAFDEAESIVLVNDPFVRTFGYTLADIPTVGDWAVRAYPEEAYRREAFAAWDAAVAKARAETGRIEAMEFRVVCKDGTARDVVFGAAVAGEFLMVTFIDVSERRRAEEVVRAMQARLERTAYELTENIPVGTYTMVQPAAGGMGSFQFLSTRFLDICGLPGDVVRSDPFKAFAIVHPDDYDEWVRKNAEVFANKLPFYGECRLLVNGAVRWISAESQPRGLPDGSTVWEGVLIDITRQKEAEAALAAAHAQERSQEETHRRDLERKLRTSLAAAAAAHEIKQPLSRILMETQLALESLRGAAVPPDEMRGYLETMLAESQHVVDMVSRMKALLRNVESKHSLVEVADVVNAAVLYSRPLLADHAVTLHEAGLDRHVQINGDSVQLQVAVINLIRNAIEAVAEGDAARREAAVTVVADEGSVDIIVGDSGPGMPADVIASLPLTTSKPDGSGLGLYLVRTCMENHGGTMTVGRSPLGGAEVRLSFPLTGGRA